jgi:Domain of unknown function (DUF4276)
MITLVFFLEEASAKALLETLLPRLLPDGIATRYIVFEGKQDLDKQLERKICGWLAPNSKFVVLRDQDDSDCVSLKKELEKKCAKARQKSALIRIACRELEAWYFGDLMAVERALAQPNLAHHSAKAKYREPDKIINPGRELRIITEQIYQKVASSRAIGSHLDLNNRNTSRSFQVFLVGLRQLTKLE